ncbi:DegV family protein [Metamycoplasma auris]|uniref:DegV family protein with EDD domain n=1 Tax=Metamycoplasma auris TaxID=51363 RepID=A0A2W7GW84_9BACT|nr:DegV family protein [Metamycoplasma auris]PZW01479.1 DegV family protein with EDD domain [Metamycoplasma auris]
MKIKIIVDSSSGLSESQANELGWGFIPLQCEIDGKRFQIGREFFIEDYKKIWEDNKKVDATTSASSPALSELEVSKYINEYDLVLIYPISKHLSSQTSFLMNQFKDNKKVYVVDSKRVSYLIVRDLLIFENKINNGIPFDEAIKHFEVNNERLILIPQFNDALVKGGRLSKSAAVIAKLLRIVPLIKYDFGILEKEGIGRVFTKSLEKTVSEMYEENKENLEDKILFVVHADSDLIESLISKFKVITENKLPIYSIKLPVDISIHTGIGAVCVTIANVDKGIKDKITLFAKKW